MAKGKSNLQIATTDGNLVLSMEGLAKRGAALFTDLNKDETLKDEFVRNPSKVIAERVTQRPLPPAQASASNRFLFSLLANDNFRAWLKVYNRRLERDAPTRDERVRDFADAVMRFGDDNLMASLAELAASGYGIPGITDSAYQFASGFVTPVNQNENANLSQNFNMSSSTFSSSASSTSNSGESSRSINDPLILLNPALVRAITEHLISHAKDLATIGKLRNLSATIE